MTEMELLKAFGDIDDKYVEEAGDIAAGGKASPAGRGGTVNIAGYRKATAILAFAAAAAVAVISLNVFRYSGIGKKDSAMTAEAPIMNEAQSDEMSETQSVAEESEDEEAVFEPAAESEAASESHEMGYGAPVTGGVIGYRMEEASDSVNEDEYVIEDEEAKAEAGILPETAAREDMSEQADLSSEAAEPDMSERNKINIQKFGDSVRQAELWADTDNEVIAAHLGRAFVIPPQTGEVSYRMREEEELAEACFTQKGTAFTLRMKKSESFEDISGAYFEWTEESKEVIDGNEVRFMSCGEGEDRTALCLMYDKKSGIMYSVKAEGEGAIKDELYSVISAQVK